MHGTPKPIGVPRAIRFTVCQFMRDNWLSDRVFRSYDAILEHCCHAWNRLADQPWRVMSLGLRDWAMSIHQ